MASQVGVFRKRKDLLRKKQIAAFLLLENKRKWWVRPWLTRRTDLGAFDTLLTELRAEVNVGPFFRINRARSSMSPRSPA